MQQEEREKEIQKQEFESRMSMVNSRDDLVRQSTRRSRLSIKPNQSDDSFKQLTQSMDSTENVSRFSRRQNVMPVKKSENFYAELVENNAQEAQDQMFSDPRASRRQRDSMQPAHNEQIFNALSQSGRQNTM